MWLKCKFEQGNITATDRMQSQATLHSFATPNLTAEAQNKNCNTGDRHHVAVLANLAWLDRPNGKSSQVLADNAYM